VAQQYRLGVSAYDRTSSLLIALLILVGLFVLGLVILYLTLQLVDRTVTVPVSLAEASRPYNAAMGVARDIEPPGIEQAPELSVPQLPATLSVIADAVASREALLAEEALQAYLDASRGEGMGDARQAGPGGEGAVERVPRWERWQIRYFSPESLDIYAKQLDFFGIEVGALGADNQVHYAYNLSKPSPDVRVGSPAEESRIRFTWRSGALEAADRQLLQRAGVLGGIRAVLQFIPPDLEARLLALEKGHEGRDVNEIRRTVFRVERDGDGDGFVFLIDEQEYF
jgi:hypothetical protein